MRIRLEILCAALCLAISPSDTGYANIQKDADVYIRECGSRLCGLHLNDNDGRDDKHQVPRQGTFVWDGFAKRLRDTGYVGPLMLELEARDRQDDLPAFLAEARAVVDRIGV